MRILICGGRDFANVDLLYHTMDSDELDLDGNQPITIITGHAKGADQLAEMYADECGWNLEMYPADWNKYGKSAGPIRNQQMLDEGKPDLVIAFPGGKGTADMVRRAKLAGIKTIEIDETS